MCARNLLNHTHVWHTIKMQGCGIALGCHTPQTPFPRVVLPKRQSLVGGGLKSTRILGSSVVAVQCEKNPTSEDAQSAVEFMGSLARSEGMRFEITNEKEEDEEEWDDLLDELGDPSSLGTLGLKGILSDDNTPHAYMDEVQVLDVSSIASLRNDREVILIDVRSSEEFASGHMEACINIPINMLQHATFQDILEARGLALSLEHAVVVVDSEDHRSKQACVRLSQVFGIEHVYCIRAENMADKI